MLTAQVNHSRILITGGSRGIGFELAKDLVEKGAQVWICGTSDSVFEAQRKLSSDLVKASILDVGSEKSVAETFAEIEKSWGSLTGVVHTAAILGQSGNFWDLDCDQFDRVLKTNVLGTFLIARHYVQHWKKAESKQLSRGKLVLFSGGGAAYGYPQFLPYGTTKAAAVRMCETISMELQAANLAIDVNIIAPGANETDMLKKVRAAGGEVRTTVPFSKPIALCNWLTSSASDRVSGRFLHVNDDYLTRDFNAISNDLFTLRRIDK